MQPKRKRLIGVAAGAIFGAGVFGGAHELGSRTAEKAARMASLERLGEVLHGNPNAPDRKKKLAELGRMENDAQQHSQNARGMRGHFVGAGGVLGGFSGAATGFRRKKPSKKRNNA